MHLSHAIPTTVKYELPTELRTPTHGARTFASILRVYACRVGPWAGWSKFCDDDRRNIINRHLAEDARRPISRATYYRWKAEATAAGLLDFESSAKRPGDRNRTEGGRWMKVLSVPASSQVHGRRPRILHETFPIPPLHETFPTGTNRRDLSPQRDPKNSLVRSENPERTDPPAITANHREAAELVTTYAVEASEAIGHPWEPLEAKEPWRLGSVGKALRADFTGQAVEELAYVVVGMAMKRGNDIARAHRADKWQPFWEASHGDVVARALSVPPSGWRRSLRESGERFLWNRHRSEELRREAMIGARAD